MGMSACDGSCWDWHARNPSLDTYATRKAQSVLLWVNPLMVHCPAPGCHKVDLEDWIEEHIAKAHPERMAQVTEQHRQKALEVVPRDTVRCPWCLCTQEMRSMAFFLASGELSKRRKCVSCDRTMEASSPTQFMQGATAFARFVAGYPGFWQKIVFESWIKALNNIGDKGEFNIKAFWDEYRRLKPKREDWEKQNSDEIRELTTPAEKRIQENWRKRAEEERRRVIAESNTKLSETDDVDETGK